MSSDLNVFDLIIKVSTCLKKDTNRRHPKGVMELQQSLKGVLFKEDVLKIMNDFLLKHNA
jgi:hypothetical protein